MSLNRSGQVQLEPLLAAIEQHRVEAPDAAACAFSVSSQQAEDCHYNNCNPRLGIDFQVQKLPFGGLQVMDPRLVVIAPGSCNEKHRHAHESIFVVLSGSAEIQIGQQVTPLEQGEIAYVPRWVVHQSRNRSTSEPLTLLAITDFGLTSAVLGDYDNRTRLKTGGVDAFAQDPQTP
ncbi:MAG: cupin domain-containing protein [Prochlorococcaceae cyanobacterium]